MFPAPERLRRLFAVIPVAMEYFSRGLPETFWSNGASNGPILSLPIRSNSCPIKNRLSEANRNWQRGAYIPQDGTNRYFAVDTALICMDQFISQVRDAYKQLELLGPEHCESGSYEKLDYEGRVLVLAPDTLKESYWNQRNQLWLAHDGFGCTPGAIGRSIRCTCLGDGEETRWNRTDFIGVLKEECLPQWAAEA